MSKDPVKEARELWAFHVFRDRFPVPAGMVESDKEEPDIVIHAPDRRIGIEITDLHQSVGARGSELKRNSSERQGVMRSLEACLRERGTPPISVHCHGDVLRGTTRRVEIATRLADYIITKIPKIGDVFARRSADRPYDPSFPPGIFAMTIARYRSLTKVYCDACESVFVSEITPEDIAGCAARKDSKVKTYRARCSEAWLLVCVNTADLSTHYSLDRFLPPEQLSTNFDRVFFLSAIESRVFEIRTLST